MTPLYVLEPPVKDSYLSNSCHGLIHMLKSECVYASRSNNYIWNPFTKKYRELPTISFDSLGFGNMHRVLEKHGFAYVSDTHEYKVVQVTQFLGIDFIYIDNQAHIFSSRSNEWETLEPFPYQILLSRTFEAQLNGVLHIVVETDSEKWELMAFDTKTKQHSMLPKPDLPVSEFSDVGLDVLQGKLCILHRMIKYFDFRMDIWVMKDYGVEASWFKLMSVALDPDLDLSPLIMNYSEDGVEVLLTDNVKKLIWYNLSGERVREVMVNVLPLEFFAEVWCESLVSFPGFINVDDGKAKIQGNDGKWEKEDDVNTLSQHKRNTSLTKDFYHKDSN